MCELRRARSPRRSVEKSRCSRACGRVRSSRRASRRHLQGPATFNQQGVDDFVLDHLGWEARAGSSRAGRSRSEPRRGRRREPGRCGSALVGKYVSPVFEDAYLSVCKALRHARRADSARADRSGRTPEQWRAKGSRALSSSRSRRHPDPGWLRRRGDRGQDRRGARVRRGERVPHLGDLPGHLRDHAVAGSRRHVADGGRELDPS